MRTPEIDLNALATGLDPAKVSEVADFIGYLKSKQERELPPVLRDAPLDDEPLTDEEISEIEAAKADAVAYTAEEMRQRYGLV